MIKLLAIVPAYNEERALPALLYALKRELLALQDAGYIDSSSIVVINDGSTDRTAAIAKSHFVTVLQHDENIGIGGAVHTGYIYAERYGFTHAVQIDGDGQHPVAMLEVLLVSLQKENAVMAIGSRYINSRGFRSTVWRRMGTQVINGVLFLLFRRHIIDSTSGFRLINRKGIELFAINYPYDYPEPISIAHLLSLGHAIIEVPVNMSARLHGSSSIKGIKCIHYMIKVLFLISVHVCYRLRVNDVS